RHQCRARPLSRLRRQGRPQSTCDAAAVVGAVRSAGAVQARVRLQPGPHGPWRHGVRAALAALWRLPDEGLLPDVAAPAGEAEGGSRVSTRTLNVVAAVVERDGCFLVTRRQAGVHLAGLWEFPGGKVAAGESHEAALRREMLEELDTDVAVRSLVSTAAHAYDDRHVTLHFYRCELAGT